MYAECRICGCSEFDACYAPDLGTCSWAEPDLCSHCVPRIEAQRAGRAARQWRRIALALSTGVAAGLGLYIAWALNHG